MDDFKHSKPYSHKLPPWAAHATSLPVRISKHEEYAAEISKNFANKLERKSVPIKSPAGQEYLGHAEFGHFVCLMVPECLPDHIPALVRALDFFCITDCKTSPCLYSDNSLDLQPRPLASQKWKRLEEFLLNCSRSIKRRSNR